jgi:hypothetical protein
VGAAIIGMGYLQQPLPSQQAGLSQQAKTVAARAGKATKSNAATANASTLSFITSPFAQNIERFRTPDSGAPLMGEGDALDPEVVFEIEYRPAILQPRSEFA